MATRWYSNQAAPRALSSHLRGSPDQTATRVCRTPRPASERSRQSDWARIKAAQLPLHSVPERFLNPGVSLFEWRTSR
jgi:hypothetical protein